MEHEGVASAVEALWGKSDAGGYASLLLQHLLDAAAVAELIWDKFLPLSVRAKLDVCADGRGRELFVLVCAVHDVGKATPAFQAKNAVLAEAVRAGGLRFTVTAKVMRHWRHGDASACIVDRADVLAWDISVREWVWPLIAGHHGRVPGGGAIDLTDHEAAQGDASWRLVQDALLERLARELGIQLGWFSHAPAPRRAVQLAIAGYVIMADWIASDETFFQGIDSAARISMKLARQRAAQAWINLRLHDGWRQSDLLPDASPEQLFRSRFGHAPRASQKATVELVAEMPVPGLVIVDAPTGEGKTKNALAVAEVFAARFGMDGLFIGMPTQATSDPIFGVVSRWASKIRPGVALGLLHGKRRFNKEWRRLEATARFGGIDEQCGDAADQALRPSEWLFGPGRGLFAAVTVGTVDQLLLAATRTRYVMLRHAGLAAKVVVIDEVHAYDVYMSQFLLEALRWLGDAGVPVVLLSATLTPTLKRQLVTAYAEGGLQRRGIDLTDLPQSTGYPSALSVCVHEGNLVFGQSDRVKPARASSTVEVEVEVLEESAPPEFSASTRSDGGEADQSLRIGDADAVVRVLRTVLGTFGCGLVVRNSVGRAQDTCAVLSKEFGAENVTLLHARLSSGARADRTERVLEFLGPPGVDTIATEGPRPLRIVVATQLAEQSLDIDADVLITDLAPMDLLIQRIGRMHRHAWPKQSRPPGARVPRVFVTGLSLMQQVPWFPAGSEFLYARYALLQAAALVLEGAGSKGWLLPDSVPELVERAYGESSVVPDAWCEDLAAARTEWLLHEQLRASRAEQFLLSQPDDLGAPTLNGLHDRHTTGVGIDDEDAGRAVVRDGEMSVEVVVVTRDQDGHYRTLEGTDVGADGSAVSDPDVLDNVLRSIVRLPARPAITQAAIRELTPLPGWSGDSWLRRTPALVLDETGSARLGGRVLRYDDQLGLIDTVASIRTSPAASRS
ncbi:CRISPR-associated endonuclease Cas3'' [Nocardia gamkensis]|uniref:CRISPR-associated endonuclease Cas3'' n=1 Tax=Nocardia gamkensis TaxID=352869 RepID=UPI0037C55B31